MSKRYRYKGLDQRSNKIVRGTMQVNNEFALEQSLRDSQITLISYNEIKNSVFSKITIFDKITVKDIITIFLHLEQMERAGVPLLDSLFDLKEYSKNPKVKYVTQSLYDSVKEGKMLSEAMERHPKVFDSISVNLVRMGEQTGNLQLAFRNIYNNIKWSYEMKRKTIKAIRYPLFSLFVMLLVATIMLKVVVPKVTGFIMEQGITIPTYTTALIKTSEFFQNYFFRIGIGLVVFYIFLKILSKIKFVGLIVDNLKLHTPVFGDLITKLEMSRFTKFFGVTFASGIPILDCLRISGSVVKNKAIKKEVDRIKQLVTDGMSVSNALSTSSYFPNMVVRMFKIGEESGNITESMDNIQYFYDSEVNDTVEKMIGMLQPMIIFFMGGLMAWVVVAVFGPIYGNFDSFGA